jgi:hypothetical protein
MSSIRYADFELVIKKVSGAENKYAVEAKGPTCRTEEPVIVEYEETKSICETLNWIRDGYAPSTEAMEEVGAMLFRTFFRGDVRDVFEVSSNPNVWDNVDADGLRLKLTVKPKQLSHLPWELLRDKFFLVGRQGYPMVRFIPGGPPADLRRPKPPLRILYVQANPGDTNKLEENDKQALLDAFGTIGEITPVWNATPKKLASACPAGLFHIVHYDGHADVDKESGKGYLLLHDDDDENKSCRFYGESLDILLNNPGLKLVVLSACKTATDQGKWRFSGVAHQLMLASNLSAVVAMQYIIEAKYAVAFTHGLYKALSEGEPVDAAVVKGRKAIVAEVGRDSDEPLKNSAWATPVLFMRTSDGYLFDLKPSDEGSFVGVSGKIESPKSPGEGGVKYFDTDQIECFGTVSGFKPGSMYLWLVVEDENGNKFPHDKVRQIDEEGNWWQKIREQGRSETFKLLLYAIAPELDKKIVEWHDEGVKKGGEFPRFLDFSEAEAEYLDSKEGLRRLLPFSDNVHGRIVEPGNGETFDTAGIQCSGTASDPVPGVHLWLFSEVDGKLYPHRGEVKVEDGKWRHRIWEGGTSEDFRLALYALGTRAHFYIEDRVKDKSCALDRNDPDDNREFFEADRRALAWAEGLRRLLRVSFDDVDVEGHIDEPQPGDKVPDPTRIRCTGTASDPLPNGVHLRLFTEIGGRLYPHRGEVKVEQGEWEHTIRELGESKEFNLVLYALDSRAHFFIKDRHKDENYSALDKDNPNDARFFSAERKPLELVRGLRKTG